MFKKDLGTMALVGVGYLAVYLWLMMFDPGGDVVRFMQDVSVVALFMLLASDSIVYSNEEKVKRQ